jgi:hypothetical protein
MRRILPLLLLLLAGAHSARALTSYWEDAAQKEIFVVAGRDYELRVATHPARILSLQVSGRHLLGPAGAVPRVMDRGAWMEPATREAVPPWEVHTGQKMKPATSSAARMNVWRASPEYWEIHLRDIPFVALRASEQAQPLRGHLVIHAHPDRAHLELSLEPAEGQKPEATGWRIEAAEPCVPVPGDRPTLSLGDAAKVLAPPGGTFSTDGKEWTAPVGSAFWVLRPAGSGVSAEQLFTPETSPLARNGFTATDGRWLGYDAPSGLYLLEMMANRPAFTFENAWKVASRRMETAIEVPAPEAATRVTVLARSGTGNLEAGMVTDPHGFPRGIPAFVVKNFAGENEETDDRAFGDIIFPLQLGPGQPREHRVMGLYQTWGRNMLKQVSSIRFFNIYWHLSTGLSETTCFTHAWMNIRNTLVSIPDFRPYSGPFLMGQPQHDCFSWPGFLNYRTKEGEVRPMYRRTDFHSVAPCLAHFTMHFRTSDDAADMSVEAWEIPQTDEARTFLRIRYDWDKPAKVEGDARKNFRWLQMFEKYPVQKLVWLDAEEKQRSATANGGDSFPLGLPLAQKWPYAGAHEGRDHFGTLMLVTRLEGKIGGRAVERAHLTADFGKDNGFYAFTTDRAKLDLQAGDFLEAEVLLMPHAEVTTPFHKPNRERLHWGERPPIVSSVVRGEKMRDFPATLRAENDMAAFKITGGLNTIPVVVGGFTAPGVPLLWRDGLWQDQQHHGGDGYQVDAEAGGSFRFTFNYPIRGTEEHDLVVSLLRTGAPLTSLRDRNGLPVASAEAPTDFAITSPVLFSPGRNVAAGPGLFAFTGRAAEIAAVPVHFAPATQDATVTCEAWSPNDVKLRVTGGGQLVVGHRVPGAEYSVTIGGETRTLQADNDAISLNIPAGDVPVRIQPKP